MADIPTNGTYDELERNTTDISVTFQACFGCVLISVAFIGVLGNVLTCTIVYRKAPMRSAINLLLTNIASADLVLSVIIAPLTSYRLFRPNDVIDLNVCIVISVIKDTMIAVTSYTLLIVSADRFLIIVHKKDRLSVATAKTYTVLVWCVSVFLALPQFLSTIKQTVIFDNTFCSRTSLFHVDVQTAYTLILTSVTFYLPMLVMFYLYASILRTVQLSSKRIHNHSGGAVSVSVTQYSNKLGLPPVVTPYRFTGDFNAKRRAFGTILILYVALLCCWLPYIAKRTEESLLGSPVPRDLAVSFVLITFGLMKSALYPLILCFRNKKMRTACLRYFPTQLNIPTRCLRIRSRRISPKTVYECRDSESRF